MQLEAIRQGALSVAPLLAVGTISPNPPAPIAARAKLLGVPPGRLAASRAAMVPEPKPSFRPTGTSRQQRTLADELTLWYATHRMEKNFCRRKRRSGKELLPHAKNNRKWLRRNRYGRLLAAPIFLSLMA